MGKITSLLYGAAIGAGLMYFLDSENGNRRKAMVRDRALQARNQAEEGLDAGVRDLRLRVRGILAEGMAMVSEEQVSDPVLEARLRSQLGFLAPHPGAIDVSVREKVVYLNGDVLSDESDALLAGIQKIRGVSQVENRLRLHDTPGDIQQLQGEGWLTSSGSRQWSPSTRLLAGIGAGYMILYGIARGGIIGTLAKAGGLALGTRAFTNLNLKRLAGMTQDQEMIRLRKTIMIDAPVEEVYGLWSNFGNFQQFMSNIEEIRDLGDGRSHWVVKGPAGTKVEFDGMVTENRPNEVVAWTTLEDSMVKHSGQVRFKEMGGRTQVNVNMSYTPPAGVLGHTIASLFGKDPKRQMDEDLARMKSLLERGKTSTEGKTVTRDEIVATQASPSLREPQGAPQIPSTGGDMGSDLLHDNEMAMEMGEETGMHADTDIRPVDDDDENERPL